MFKIGDRVICNYHFNDECWPKGYEFTITDITKDRNSDDFSVHGATKTKVYGIGGIPMKNVILVKSKIEYPLFHHEELEHV